MSKKKAPKGGYDYWFEPYDGDPEAWVQIGSGSILNPAPRTPHGAFFTLLATWDPETERWITIDTTKKKKPARAKKRRSRR